MIVLSLSFMEYAWADDNVEHHNTNDLADDMPPENGDPYDHDTAGGDGLTGESEDSIDFYKNETDDDDSTVSPHDYPENYSMENDDTGDFYEPESPDSYNPEESI
ncbi:MAG: hypothetical protein K2X98_02275 [Alphaproteobacteria bacterium]|nr:hypothetical protein [Alphaproteobacteria bacterium]